MAASPTPPPLNTLLVTFYLIVILARDKKVFLLRVLRCLAPTELRS